MLCLCAASAHACVCVTPAMKWSFKRHDIVVIGRIDEVSESRGSVYHHVKVVQALKGLGKEEELTIRTEMLTSCGFYMPKGDERLIMAHREPDGQVVADPCSNPLSYKDPDSISLARRRAWWWRLGVSSIGWYRLTHRR